ncbi:MAG: hypothetical protein AB2551_02120 [Candidatus Thiodiazotropha sp.]
MNNRDTGLTTFHKSIITALGLGFFSSAFSASWMCTDVDNWNNSACWSGSVIPGESAAVNIEAASGSHVTVNYNDSTNPPVRLGDFYLNAAEGGTATLIRNDNYALNSSYFFLGEDGTGVSSVIHNSGSSQFGTGSIGKNGGANGYYELNGTGNLRWQRLELGLGGSGVFVQSGGTHTIDAGGLSVGAWGAGSGHYTLQGGTLNVNGLENVGHANRGVFTQNGGTHNVRRLYIGRWGNGLFEMNDGALNVAEWLEIGTTESGNGSFVQNGGRVNIAGSTAISATGIAAGSYQLNGGTLQTAYVDNNDRFEHSGGLLIGDVVNQDQLLFSGTGTRQVQGSVTNTGETVFQPWFGGERRTRTAHSSITLSEGTALHITENLQLDDLGSFTIELGGDSFGLDNFVQVDGIATLGGILELELFSDFIAQDGDRWTLFSASHINGLFSEALLNESFVDLDFSLAYTGTTVDLIATSVAPVPVPAAVWLFGSGLVGILTLSRRGRKTAPATS